MLRVGNEGVRVYNSDSSDTGDSSDDSGNVRVSRDSREDDNDILNPSDRVADTSYNSQNVLTIDRHGRQVTSVGAKVYFTTKNNFGISAEEDNPKNRLYPISTSLLRRITKKSRNIISIEFGSTGIKGKRNLILDSTQGAYIEEPSRRRHTNLYITASEIQTLENMPSGGTLRIIP